METLDKWKHLPYYNMRVFTLDCPCPAYCDTLQTIIEHYMGGVDLG